MSPDEEQGTSTDEPGVEDRYREMLSGLQLKRVTLIETASSRNVDVDLGDTAIDVEKRTEFLIKRDNPRDFRFVESLHLKASKDSDGSEDSDTVEIFSLLGSFLLEYLSPVETDEQMLEMFAQRNLSVHSWPYLREYTQNMITRMGLPPLVLPLILPKPKAE